MHNLLANFGPKSHCQVWHPLQNVHEPHVFLDKLLLQQHENVPVGNAYVGFYTTSMMIWMNIPRNYYVSLIWR